MALALMALAAALQAPGGSGPERDCRATLIEDRTGLRREGGAVSPRDLAQISDFGPQHVSAGSPPSFSLSPDGRFAALVLRRGDPDADTYCIGVLVVPVEPGGTPRLVDHGGELILAVSDVRGIADLPVGNAEPVLPSWSPDGRQLAYLRRDGGVTRVWTAWADGTGAAPLPALETEPRGVRWSEDGRALIVRVRPGIAISEAAIDAEERSGFLYDRRFWTLSRGRPGPAPTPALEQRIEPATGRALGPPVAQDAAPGTRPPGALLFAAADPGYRAWTSAINPDVVMGATALHIEVAGKRVPCRSVHCSDAIGSLWWDGDGSLFWLRSGTPGNGGITRLLRWDVRRRRQPEVILSTADALMGCMPAGRTIVCARETAIHPRTIVSVDPATGRRATVYDPNPRFRDLAKGAVTRLRWETPEGVPAYGDLVLPSDRSQSTKLPLILVQYHSRGFLRGGTGDEYPVHALAARGFAVLSVERPSFVAAGKARSRDEFLKMSMTGFAERRSVLSSLEAGVAAAVATGAVDAARIGITGLSDGAATVQFALVNSALFGAAAMSSCCDDPSTAMFAAGPGYKEQSVSAGYPPPGSGGEAFWRRYSLASNAERIRTPILLQVPDDEFRFALETFTTLDEQRVPVEMHVFADGYHQKWRPAQRLASYERAIDWFDFWLNGKEDQVPAKAAQYARWRSLAARQPR